MTATRRASGAASKRAGEAWERHVSDQWLEPRRTVVTPRDSGGPVSGGVMYKLDQMQLVCDIEKLLADKHGVVDVSARHMNAIIDAANRLCDEFNRNDVTAVAGAGLAAWFGSDHVGMSSAFMARRLAPLAGLVCPPHRIRDDFAYPHYPHDPSDFWRCLKLLEAVPELSAHIPAMAEHGAIWSAYVEHWAEMTALYAAEEPKGSAPKLHALMKRLQKESKW